MLHGQSLTFSCLQRDVVAGEEYVWFHAASLGEFEQGRPLMEAYRKYYPRRKILLTFFSPSGYEVRKNYQGADIVCYLPVDTLANARRFLDLVHPVEAFFIKYEYWYNYVQLLNSRGVPVYSVSSIFRSNQLFFKWYGSMYAYILKLYTHFFVQNRNSKVLLHSLGISNVDIVGDTRFDRVSELAYNCRDIPEIKQFVNGKKLFVAGSSWTPDENVFIPYFKQRDDWKMIIAPHVIDHSHLDHIAKMLYGKKIVRYSHYRMENAKLGDADVLVIDCFGLLSSIYKYADVTYVGGGFGAGIHNLLEAAVWNKPVIFGPNNHKFQEARDLKNCNGGFEIRNANEFNLLMDRFNDEAFLCDASIAAGKYVKSKIGATEKIMRIICSNAKE